MINQQPIVLHHSIFKPKPHGHGGERRTAQILEILKKHDVVVDSLDWRDSDSKSTMHKFVRIPLYIWYFIKFCFQIRTAIFPSKSKILFVGFSYNYFVTDVKPKLKNKFAAFIWESTYDKYFLLPFLIKKHKIRIIALPHNLESLVPERVSYLFGKRAPNWLTNEIEKLKIAESVFTISREEEWLLSLYQLPTHYLPYLPICSVIDEYKSLHKKRVAAKNFLLIGSATNPPTYLGMKKLINELEGQLDDIHINVAGFGTERLFEEHPNLTNFNILGTLNTDELNAELTSCKAIIIFNIPSTGVLTKVSEFLIAGIPLILDAGSARSFYNINGLKIYNDMPELRNIILTYSSSEQPVYTGDEILDNQNFENYFINAIKKFNKE